MIDLHIITPISRPENIAVIADNLSSVCKELKPIWYCCFDAGVKIPKQPRGITYGFWGKAKKKSFSGNSSRNQMLDLFQSGWTYFLDDDNLLHPNFEKHFLAALQEHPDAQWFIFDQVRKDGSLYLEATPQPIVNHVDSGQCVLKRELIGSLRFIEHYYAADGVLYTSLLLESEPIVIKKIATYYNALR